MLSLVIWFRPVWLMWFWIDGVGVFGLERELGAW